MIFNLSGGGSSGAALNFKVVGGTTEPANPSENTIWVNTDTEITSWIFSADEPTEPAEGMVWITTGTSRAAEFNALKKNGIQVYPISAKQYVGGAWVDVTAKSYQGGEWVDWYVYLYSSGGDYSELWGVYDPAYNSKLTLTFGDYMAFTTPAADGGTGMRATLFTNAYDFTGVKRVDVKLKNTAAVKIGIASSPHGGSNYAPVWITSQSVAANTADFQTVSIELSGIGSAYFALYFSAGASVASMTATFEEIALIK